jgi:hypothetical protein
MHRSWLGVDGDEWLVEVHAALTCTFQQHSGLVCASCIGFSGAVIFGLRDLFFNDLYTSLSTWLYNVQKSWLLVKI